MLFLNAVIVVHFFHLLNYRTSSKQINSQQREERQTLFWFLMIKVTQTNYLENELQIFAILITSSPVIVFFCQDRSKSLNQFMLNKLVILKQNMILVVNNYFVQVFFFFFFCCVRARGKKVWYALLVLVMILIYTNLYFPFIFCICYNAKLFSPRPRCKSEMINNSISFYLFFFYTL